MMMKFDEKNQIAKSLEELLPKDHLGKDFIQASQFNLVVYSQESRRTEFLKKMMRNIIELFPCRIIFIDVEKEADENFLQVKASQELIDKGEAIISCDLISVQVSFQLLQRVPYIVLPNLISDLPIFLLWGQDPTLENEIFPHLKKIASKLFFDSECTANLQQFCRIMLGQLSTWQIEVMDFNWAQMSSWREIIAQVFDSPEKVQDLDHINKVRIAYNTAQAELVFHAETQSIYLQGWLSSRLGWSFVSKQESNGVIQLKYKKDSREITVLLSAELREEMNPGTILGIEFSTDDNHFYILQRQQDSSKVKVHISTSEKCELPFTLTLHQLRKSYSFMELFYRPTSEHYLQMLKAIEPIDWNKRTDLRKP